MTVVSPSSRPSQATDAAVAQHRRAPIRPIRVFTTTAYGYDAFLSYSRRDALEYAVNLQAALESNKLTVFRDESDLAPGDSLTPSIRARLRRSRYVIVLDTPEARQSKDVKDELEYAIEQSLHVIRIAFPRLCGNDDQWHLLAPFKEQLLREIWLTDESEAPLRTPQSGLVEVLQHTHRTQKVRVSFLRLVLVVACLVGTAIAVGVVSAHARHRATDALQSFRKLDTSFADARRRARDLFSSRWFPLHDLFVAEQHWELKEQRRYAGRATPQPRRPRSCRPGCVVQDRSHTGSRSPGERIVPSV